MLFKNILVSMPKHPGMVDRFQNALPGANFTFAREENLTEEQMASFDAVVGNIEVSRLEKMKQLKLLQLISSGVGKPYVGLLEQNPSLILCSASGAYGPAIAEHLLATLLALLKNLHLYRDDMKSAAWKTQGVKTPRGMKVLVVGAGNIGTEFAKRMRALGSEVIGLRRSPGGEMEGFDAMYTMERLDSLLPQMDVVALCLPETPDTINLMDERRFALLKPGGYLLNVGRGSAVNQEALLSALRSGHLAGASLDVTTPEPLPKDHPLWQEENLLLTPHISGHHSLQDTYDKVVDLAIHNLKAWPDGPYIAQIDANTGYRAR